jgi:hypothetical protein
LAHNIQAIRYDPRPSRFLQLQRRDAVECVIKNAVQDQIVSSRLLARMLVLSVTEESART